jgi:cytochrome o ubiquinol oxidase subunit III
VSGSTQAHIGLHLDSPDQNPPEDAELGIYGFWIFLMSDAVLFALLFAIYGTQLAATAGAPGPAAEFKLGPAFIETVILRTVRDRPEVQPDPRDPRAVARRDAPPRSRLPRL